MRNAAILVLLLPILAPVGLLAQERALKEIPPILHEKGQPEPPADPNQPLDETRSAEFTRQRLQQMLWQLPPAVRGVLQYDPTLADRPDYLAPYPTLQAFLKQHPEIARNPSFFFGNPDSNRRNHEAMDAFAAILAGTGLFLGFMTIVVMMGSVARQVVEYRRWARQTRMQTEVHTKILDRMQSNEDLLAYVQTPAGRNFLDFAPGGPAPEPRQPSAPLGRILWSVQAGVVLTTLGIGLRFAQGTVPEEIMPGFTVLGIIVTSLGLGAVVSAVIAYVLSSRLGLLPSRRQETNA
jgi:hypothetical protein